MEIASCGLLDMAMETISDMLKYNKTLQDLNIGNFYAYIKGNNVIRQNEGAEFISNGLLANQYLKSINLRK